MLLSQQQTVGAQLSTDTSALWILSYQNHNLFVIPQFVSIWISSTSSSKLQLSAAVICFLWFTYDAVL